MYRSLLIPVRLSPGVSPEEIPAPALAELFRQHYGLVGLASPLLPAPALLAASPILASEEDASRHYLDLEKNGHHVRLPESLHLLVGERTYGILIAVPKGAHSKADLASLHPHVGCLEWMTAAKLLMDQLLGLDHAVSVGYPVATKHAIAALCRTNHAGAFIASLPPTLDRSRPTLSLWTRETDSCPTRLELCVELLEGDTVVHSWAAPQLDDEEHLEAAYSLMLHAQVHGLARARAGQAKLLPATVPLEDSLEPTWVQG